MLAAVSLDAASNRGARKMLHWRREHERALADRKPSRRKRLQEDETVVTVHSETGIRGRNCVPEQIVITAHPQDAGTVLPPEHL